MQPPPQAVPSGLVGPPPAGNPQSMFWSNSPYRRQVNNSAPAAPITCPLQPVTDPFAFSRQTCQNTPLGTSSKSSPPVLQDSAPAAFLQRSGQPVPHTNVRDSSQGPCEPPPRPQPRSDPSPLPSVLATSTPLGLEMNRSAEVAPGSEPEVQAPLYPPPYIPGAGPDGSVGGHSHGKVPEPDRTLSRQNLHDGASAAPPFFPQALQQVPGQWGPVQGGPPPSGQPYWPCPEGPVPNSGPQASTVSHLAAVSSLCQGPGQEHHNPLVSLPGPFAGDRRNEGVYLQSGNHSVNHFDSENAFRQSPRVGNNPAGQELRLNPGMKKEQLPALVNPLTQGNSLESHLHSSPGTKVSRTLPEVDSGGVSMFFQGGETENVENLSSVKTGSAGPPDLDSLAPNPGLGHSSVHAVAGGLYQAFLKTSGSETVQGGDAQPYFSQSVGFQHEKQAAKSAVDLWGGGASFRAPDTSGPPYENVENLEFVQNQEVLPSEPLSLDPSVNDQLRNVSQPGSVVTKHGVGHVGGGGLNIEAPDAALYPIRSDSVSSSYSSKSHRSLSGMARPQDLTSTFIQQEVGKPEDEPSGSFFKQIDSSPIGGEVTGTTVSPNYQSNLSQPSAPSPPKPVGIFQTSANSSFEPVKSHLIGVKPVEADRANMVGEVRGPLAHHKQRRSAAAPPDASPGNLEQPPDNMETLFTPQVCPQPLISPGEPTHGSQHVGGSPLETPLPTPEKRHSNRVHGVLKCESPATSLWAQNELPDFGGNVVLAPAAPILHVPAKLQSPEVIQPPDEGVSSRQSQQPDPVPPLQSGDSSGASENLENPPKMGEEDTLLSQASSGYASLLSSPPTESLQNQPVLIAQPDQSYNLDQPVSFSVPLSNPNEKNQSWRDALVGEKSTVSCQAAGADSGENAFLSGIPTGSLICSPLSNSLAQSNFPQVSGFSEMGSNQPTSLLAQPPSHLAPKNLLPEGQKIHNMENFLPELVANPAGSTGVVLAQPVNNTSVPSSNIASLSSNQEDTLEALDFTLSRTSESCVSVCSPSYSNGPSSYQHTMANLSRQSEPGPHNPDHFYQQVMKDAQDQSGLERTQQKPVPPSSQGPKTTRTDPSNSGSPLAQGQSQNSAQPPANATPGDTDQQSLPRPPPSSSASVLSAGSSHTAVRSEQQWTQSPPPEYYYYRSMYDGYQSQCPSLYPPDASTGSLYYQDVYSMYDPRYRAYDSTASAYAENYRYPEPERPSSRASHCSDRPHARREYPEGYYNSKSGWSSQSDYYANYYSGQYEYGDAGRWDRYHYSARFRDPRHYDQRYWYDSEHDPYKKESYCYSDRHDKYDDLWRYDPRITGSFDEDPEPRRDPYGEDTDRRSVHSEHSAQSLRSAASLHSHRSSVSSQSHQSQIYRSHNVAASTYEAPPPPGSFHGDYPYSSYGGHFNGAQEFSEYSYAPDTSWPTADHVPSRPTTPEKFSVPHVCARFGPGGHLIKVIANLPSEGQPALVEIHSMETLLQHTPEQEEMRAFPGPLGKDDTHKVDVINFAQNKATKCLQNENLIDKESASLLWSFIVLLCRQNGTVVGTDIAELLLRDHKTVWLPGKSPNEANLIDFTNEAVEQVEEEESGEAQLSFLTDNLTATTSTLEKEIERFRELLLYGRKKDALESAMKNALWGHALLLASKMDSRTHARVMTRFANSLPINDPLQTVYQLMSGRMPAASTCCGDEKWGDWRPHLAMVLSNLSNNMDVESRTMVTMGDTLASKGLLDAAHFCYLMAQVGFGVYTKKTTKLVLIGSNHSLPFLKFASNEAIQRTEAYEYAQSLGAQTGCLPNFQVFKFIYSCRLAEMGLATQAFHYCEVIAKSILAQPHQFSPVLISQLIQVASQLRLFDPQLKEKPEEEAFQEPSWLAQLQHVEKQIKEGNVVWTQDSAFPQQCPSTPNSEVGQCESQELSQPVGLGTDNPLLAPPVPGSEPFNQSVQLLPSAPQMLSNVQLANPAGMPVFPILLPAGPVEPGPISAPLGSALGYPETSGPSLAALYPGPGLPPGTSSLPEPRSLEPGIPQEAPDRKPLSEPREGNFGGNFTNLGPSGMPQDSEQASTWEPPPPAPTPAPEVKRPGQASKKENKEPKKSSEPWFFSRWLSGKKRTEAYLPDDKNKSIVWDEKKNRWVDMNEPEEEKKVPPPPPAAIPKAPQAVAPGPGGPLRPSVNMFSRKAAGNKARYVDILNPAGTQRSEPVLAPASFLAPLAPLPIPAHLMGPNPETEASSAEGAGREGQIPAGGQEPASEAKQPFGSAASLPGSELPPPGVDGSQGGEAPSDPPTLGAPPGGAVPFYNPAQFVPTTATSGNSRTGRIGQRKYPALS